MKAIHSHENRKTETFIQLLKLATYLPKPDSIISKSYQLTRQQMYLIFLVGKSDQLVLDKQRQLADLLNISPSTLSRNISKLVDRKVMVKTDANSLGLKLISQGQLYFNEINELINKQMQSIEGLYSLVDKVLAEAR